MKNKSDHKKKNRDIYERKMNYQKKIINTSVKEAQK